MVFLIITLVIMAVLNSRNQQTVNNQDLGKPSSVVDVDTQRGDLVPPSPMEANSPEVVARAFYDWYTTHPNPLGSRAYLNSPYISNDYKDSIEGFVVRGDYLESDPVLTCVDVKPPKSILAQTAVYDTNRLRASVNLQEDVEGSRVLYEVLLANINGEWLVDDVRCTL